MNDLEISRRLALAIGWQKVFTTGGCVMVSCGTTWRVFDHCEWDVAGPIAQRYNKFPYMQKTLAGVPDGEWVIWPDTLADTPQAAIALAVINGEKK
jgi:hypothetical protein